MRFAFFTAVSIVALSAYESKALSLQELSPQAEHNSNMLELGQMWTDMLDQHSDLAQITSMTESEPAAQPKAGEEAQSGLQMFTAMQKQSQEEEFDPAVGQLIEKTVRQKALTALMGDGSSASVSSQSSSNGYSASDSASESNSSGGDSFNNPERAVQASINALGMQGINQVQQSGMPPQPRYAQLAVSEEDHEDFLAEINADIAEAQDRESVTLAQTSSSEETLPKIAKFLTESSAAQITRIEEYAAQVRSSPEQQEFVQLGTQADVEEPLMAIGDYIANLTTPQLAQLTSYIEAEAPQNH